MKTFKEYIKELRYGPTDPVSKNVIDTTKSAAEKDKHYVDSIKSDPNSVINRGREQPSGIKAVKNAPLQPPRETVIMKGERN